MLKMPITPREILRFPRYEQRKVKNASEYKTLSQTVALTIKRVGLEACGDQWRGIAPRKSPGAAQ